MRKFTPALLLVLSLTAYANLSDTKPKVATLEEYQKILEVASKWSDNLTNDKYYDDHYTFKDKKTGEVKKLADLPPFDRDMFYVFQAEKLTKQLIVVHEKWTANLQSMKDSKDNQVKKADVEKFLVQLLTVRKKTAVRYEQQIDKVFKAYPNKFTTEEKEQYLKTVRKLHDKDKLIERK